MLIPVKVEAMIDGEPKRYQVFRCYYPELPTPTEGHSLADEYIELSQTDLDILKKWGLTLAY